MTVHHVVQCPECRYEFNPYRMTVGRGLMPECLRDIELLCRKIRHLNKGDGAPQAERLLTRVHEAIGRLARGGTA